MSQSAKFLETINPFVIRLKKTPDQITETFIKAKWITEADDAAADVLLDKDCISDDDFVQIFAGEPTPMVKKALKEMRGVGTTTTTTTTKKETITDPNAELPEGKAPTQAQVHGFAGQLGIDPMTMMMLMNGNLGENMNIASMIPVKTVVDGYNPKRRDMFLMVMGQLESHVGVPIVVINSDGSINRTLTNEYIEGLEEGRDPATDDIYYDGEGTPHEIIKVGVDAQSIYDADPLDTTKALQKSGMGIGRINWNGVPLEVKQAAHYATKTGEIDPASDSDLTWLRDNVKKGKTKLVLHGKAPKAIALFNEANRTGSLPTLRVMLTHTPRRQENMPRRRKGEPKNLSHLGNGRQQPYPMTGGDAFDEDRQPHGGGYTRGG